MTDELDNEKIEQLLKKLLPKWLFDLMNRLLAVNKKEYQIRLRTIILAAYMAGYGDAVESFKRKK